MMAELLDRFTSIAVTPETHFITRYLHRLDRFGDLSEQANRLNLTGAIVREPRYRLLGLNRDAAALAAEPWRDYAQLVRLLYERFAESRGKSRWADQTPFYGESLAELAALLPDAKFIHMIRDGRDCALSVMNTTWGPTNIYRAALWWKEGYRHTAEAGRALEASRYLEVRYEDLLGRPEEQMRRVCDFVAEPIGERLVSVCRGEADADYQLKRRNTDKWRTALNDDQKRMFEAIAGAELEKSGYPREYPGARVPGRMIRWWYRIDHRVRSVPANVQDAIQWARRQAA